MARVNITRQVKTLTGWKTSRSTVMAGTAFTSVEGTVILSAKSPGQYLFLVRRPNSEWDSYAVKLRWGTYCNRISLAQP
jgi:hypothetical protein